MCYNPITTQQGQTYRCGKCEKCHNTYIQHWTFRLQNEMRVTHRSLFLTLTYDYDNIPINKGKFTLCKEDYQKFLKRLRKVLPDRRIKYVVCGEYGSEKGRPHYHLILFGVDKDDFNIVNQCWGKGQINVGSVTPASIAYTFKYAVKGDIKGYDWRQQKQFIAMSKGLGETFAFNISYINTTHVTKKGNIITRKTKVRTPKAHFEHKLKTLLDMPYYLLPSAKGGTVKMSVPRFYLDAAHYDKTELTELYLDKMAEKYDNIIPAHIDVICEREQIQRIESVNTWKDKRIYTVSKESKEL